MMGARGGMIGFQVGMGRGGHAVESGWRGKGWIGCVIPSVLGERVVSLEGKLNHACGTFRGQ